MIMRINGMILTMTMVMTMKINMMKVKELLMISIFSIDIVVLSS